MDSMYCEHGAPFDGHCRACNEKQSVKTFRDLEQMEAVTPADLLGCLDRYACGGMSISARVVKGVVSKANPNAHQLSRLKAIAQKGVYNQTSRQEFEAAAEYKDLLNHLNSLRNI